MRPRLVVAASGVALAVVVGYGSVAVSAVPAGNAPSADGGADGAVAFPIRPDAGPPNGARCYDLRNRFAHTYGDFSVSEDGGTTRTYRTELIVPPLRFAKGSERLDGEAKLVDEIVDLVACREVSLVAIELGGHTSRDEKTPLAEKRALALQNALAARGMPSALVTARGFGATKPLVVERDEATRAQNRRVELVFRASK